MSKSAGWPNVLVYTKEVGGIEMTLDLAQPQVIVAIGRASAIALLKEHYGFAPDNFEFYVPFLEDAAAYLRTNSVWAFWWD